MWPRVKTSLTRDAAYEKLLAADGLFMDHARTARVVGKSYALRTTTGEKYSGKTELRKDGRGFCISVSELNDALLWVTMEGTTGALEVQIWLSAFGVAPANLAEFGERWKQRLETLVGAAVA